MPVRYTKRLQMIVDFRRTPIDPIELPVEFHFVPWHPTLSRVHAEITHRGFRNDSDGNVFPTFKNFDRCLRLMESIAASDSFVAEATLLIAHGLSPIVGEYVANIQGMQLSPECGAIQNVTVLPAFRQRGLGRAIVLGALRGFHKIGVQKVSLDVTANNYPAIKLYTRIGFQTARVHFKETTE